MAQFTIYRSTDASAPTLSGTNDSLCALIRACLVDGYGAQAAAGWTVAFDGTNKTAFQQGAGSGFYLRIQDDGPGAGGAREARIIGYETMSDVDTGTGPFPTAAQMANGMFARKSTSADATARPWIVFADNRTVYFFSDNASNGIYQGCMFGDIYSYVPSDAYNCMIIGQTTENSNAANQLIIQTTGTIVAATVAGNYIARGYLGSGGSVLMNKHAIPNWNTATNFGAGLVTYPNPSDGAFVLSPIWVTDPTTGSNSSLRGILRGMWNGCHPIANVTNGDTFSGMADLAGRSFLVLKQVQSLSVAGYLVFETSNTLPTN